MQTNSPISDAEVQRRQAVTRGVMADLGLDALISQAREDRIGGYARWPTDVPATNDHPRTAIVFADRQICMVEMGAFGTDRASDPTAPATRGVDRVLGTSSFHSVGYAVDYETDLAVAALCDAAARHIGTLCPQALPHGLMRALAAGIETVDATDALDRVKAIKSAEEFALIHATAALQDAIFAEVCDFLRPGVTDRHAAANAEAGGRRMGSARGIYLGLSAPLGVPSRFLKRPFQTRTLQPGDHMSLLIGVNGPGGLCLEIARTMVLGQAEAPLLEAFAIVRAARDHTLSLMCPGADPAAIAQAHDDCMTARGLPPETRLYAHGQGCEMVERPLIRRDETRPLAEGMLLAVHPGYDDGRVFAVICNNYMVGADGMHDCPHRTDKKIFEL